jgi:hypothetical protein
MMPHNELALLGLDRPLGRTPLYEQVDDFLLIGTDHNQAADKEIHRLRKEIESADHVFVEGYRWGDMLARFRQRGSRNTCDVAVFEYGAGKLRYLEEGLHLVNLAERYGIQKRQVGVFESLYHFIVSGRPVSLRGLLDNSDKHLQMMGDSPAYEGIDRDITLRSLQYIYPRMPRGTREVVGVYKSFMSKARDINHLCPAALLGKELDGKKIAVVGVSHIRMLKRALEGMPVKDLPTWQQITSSFFEPYKTATHILEQLIEEIT